LRVPGPRSSRPVATSVPAARISLPTSEATIRAANLEPPSGNPGARERDPLTIVGIGASAGGLKALQHFFGAVPTNSGMAYVVIMHLDPERESRIPALLQDRTAVPVTQVTGTTTVERDHVYVIPPGQDLTMQGREICVQDRGDDPQHAPVDLFLRTLAVASGADAIGVVLSGTGTDGAAGTRSIKEHGGITVAQSPEDAEFDGMPASAIATGQIDLVSPSALIPAELLRLRRMPSPLHIEAPPEDSEAQLTRIFDVLQEKTGHDFSPYKRSTVLRRLERRLRFNGVENLEDYLAVLRKNEAEPATLMRDLLISVSSFFRDPEAFAALADAIPTLFEGKGPSDALRVWVAGCATGEEAYSIAILLSEHAATLEQPPRIQIFATDLDEKGYAWGREALYPASAVTEIPPERLRQFFTREAGGFRVRKSLREEVLFAVHDVLRDPPFSQLDLISCRNLLIYLQPEAQEKAIETFHYALRAEGLLFLGSSETAGESGHFVPVTRGRRIYRRNAAPQRAPPRLSAADPQNGPGVPAAAAAEARRPQRFAYGALHLRMLEQYAPASLVVDERLDVVHRSGTVGRYLHLGEGEPSHNLMDLTRGELRMELRTALHRVFSRELPTTLRHRTDGGDLVDIAIHPPIPDASSSRFSLVVFGEAESPDPEPTAHRPVTPERGRKVARLEEELRLTREQLEATHGVRDRMVEDLQSANEELMSINEEQKAAAEELETSREEIQSINEELTTINQEHQSTIEEVKRTNDDLQNLIESTEIGTIFLDRAMRIRRFTPTVAELFNFVATDQGRPLAHITHRLDYAELLGDARSVLATQERIEREVSSDTGEWFIVRINPYRSAEGEADGVVFTFFDHTAHRRVQEELREAKIVAESASANKGSFLATMSHEFRTPLTAMLGYADILDLDGPLTAGQIERVDRIKACGWHLTAMINEILTFAKLDEGRETVTYEMADARLIARETKVLVESAAATKGLQFVLTLPDDAIALETDGDKVRQILVNLCGNAIKYTERGRVRLEVRAEGNLVVFEVHDTGIGISPEDLPHVFDRFWQADHATTRSFGGLGIGLAAAREFSRLLGGDVEVESEVDRGSTFRAWLPHQRVVA
jgi:two-component system, chemotaxis family, CheB/CheR fusion protein